jgi:hypothetical protein
LWRAFSPDGPANLTEENLAHGGDDPPPDDTVTINQAERQARWSARLQFGGTCRDRRQAHPSAACREASTAHQDRNVPVKASASLLG